MNETELEAITHEVVSKVADAKDTPSTELTQLGKVIDTDALEALVSSDWFVGVRFRYEGYTVVIDRDTNITLQEESN